MRPENFFNFNDLGGGVERELAPGVNATVHTGEHAQISVVRIDPNTEGKVHHHPEEQWGFCLEGSGLRFQADEWVPVSAGDFWRSPPNVPHTIKAGSEGMKVIDVFAPPRKAYETAGSGFGTEDA